jgi:hypothetical protein
VSIDNVQAFSVPIPPGFQFQGPDDLIFEAAETVTFPPASAGPLTVPTYQGQTLTETFVSDGTSKQVFELAKVPDESFVTGGSVIVTVDGVPWEEKEFLEFEETDQFEIGYNDDPPTVRFGDGITGNIPATGASIVVTYIVSRGKGGLVNSGTIDDVVTPLVVSFTQINLTITNPSGSIGGDDPEDIEKAKTFAPKVYKSRYVAVTREDYEALAGSYADPLFGRVAVAQALSSRSADKDLALQNYIAGIRALADDPLPIVQSNISTLESSFGDLTTQLGLLEDALTEAVSLTNDINATEAPTTLNAFRAIKNESDEVYTDASDADTAASAVETFVSAIPTPGPSQLDVADQNTILGYLATIRNEQSSIQTHASSIGSTASSGVSTIGTIKDKIQEVGTDLITSGTYMYDADQTRQAMETIVGESATPTGMYVQTASILAVVTDTSTEIGNYLDDIYDHVDKLLAADCKANLVTVPILSRDVAGFYAAPSTGLIKSLQSFLEERNEVTQTVKVVSGVNYLVPAVLTIEIGVLPDFSQSVTEAATVTATEELLKNRSFGQSLYKSIVMQTILQVSGVGYTNVTIDGSYEVPLASTPVLDTSHLDSDGNLILSVSEVLTRGLVTVTSTQLTALDVTKMIKKLDS